MATTLGVRPEWLSAGEEPMLPPPPFVVEVGQDGGIQAGASSTAVGKKSDTHIAQYGRTTDIPPHLLARAIVLPRVNKALQPTGDGVLADHDDVILRVGRPDVLITEMPTDAFEGRIERGTQIEVIKTGGYVGTGIYYIELDGRGDVARVQAFAGTAYRLSYDNPAYTPFVLAPVEDKPGVYYEPESGFESTLVFLGRIEGSHRRH